MKINSRMPFMGYMPLTLKNNPTPHFRTDREKVAWSS